MGELQPGDPSRIGPYRVTEVLGSGGMGRVYLGRSAGGRLVAVKVIRAEFAADSEFRVRFRREVELARRVHGFYTAMVVDADVDAQVPWLATAYVPAPSLAEAVARSGPLAPDALRSLAAGLAEGLGAIHAAGLVHRDLKPSNVLLAGDGPRVIDFGISRAAEATVLTAAGQFVGSPGYASPEQAAGGDVGPASDVFSLGAVVCFAATGRGPFGDGAVAALIYRVVHGEPDLDGVPAGIRPLLERCLAKAAAERPAAAEILAELAGAEHGDAEAGDIEPGNAGLASDLAPGPVIASPHPVQSRPDVPTMLRVPSMPPESSKGRPAASGTTEAPEYPATETVNIVAAPPPADTITPEAPARRIRRWTRRRVLLRAAPVAAAAAAAAVVIPLVFSGPSPAKPPPAELHVYPNAVGKDRTGIAADRDHVWLVSYDNGTVDELDAGTGARVQTLSGGSYAFGNDDPYGVITDIVDDGTHVWVASAARDANNPAGTRESAVTEINAADGALVKVITDPGDPNFNPRSLSVSGAHVWVLNGTTGGTTDDTGTVTEISAVDGTVTRELDGVLGQGFAEWRRLAASGPYVWVLNVINPLSLTQLDAVTGNVLRDIPVDRNYYQIVTAGSLVWLLGDGYATAFNASTGHAVRTVTAGLTRLSVSIGDGSRIWISQASGDSASVDEYDAATGAWLRNASGSRYHLDIGPGIVDKYLPMAAAGGRVWVLSSYSGSVTEFAAG